VGTRLDRKFFESTRGQIVTLLRRAGLTVDELAQEVGLTNNGVRAHLATLERDGIVRQSGAARRESGGGKPAYVYELTPEAEGMFPKAYEPTLRRLLDVLAERIGQEESEALLRAVGRSLAEGKTARAGGPRARLEAAVGVFNDLGGLAELEERDGAFVIRGYSCPLAAVATDHPEVCRMAETLISELADAPVHEHCDRSVRPRCCFELRTHLASKDSPRDLRAGAPSPALVGARVPGIGPVKDAPNAAQNLQ
jgi:predicted ArsR family transcriptional regulator